MDGATRDSVAIPAKTVERRRTSSVLLRHARHRLTVELDSL